METDKPQISILLAVYEPRMDWLRELLLSLDAQTYPNLKLYIRDDSSCAVSFDTIQSCVQDCIHAFPYKLRRNESNVGSNRTFEKLTQEADGAYFAYCDQDDVWLPEKLQRLETLISQSGALLACSDMTVIDECGVQTAASITRVRRHHVFRSGENLAPQLVFRNWVTGCTMLVRADTAKAAVPFCPYMVHDHYLALYCADKGAVVCTEERLIQYRIHGNNQTGVLVGVGSKAEYLQVRVVEVRKKLDWLTSQFPAPSAGLKKAFADGLCWVKARESYLQRRGGGSVVWKHRKYGRCTALFELLFPFMPERLFLSVVHLARKNVL